MKSERDGRRRLSTRHSLALAAALWLLFALLGACQFIGRRPPDQAEPVADPSPAVASKDSQDLATASDSMPGIYQRQLGQTGQRYTILIPDGYDGRRPVPLVLALHFGGRVTPFYGRLVLEALVAPALAGLGAIIVAPDSRAGGWATPESEADVLALLDFVEASYNIDAGRRLVTGFSLGGSGTWYLAGRNPDRFTAAIPIAGSPPPDTTDREWSVPLYVIHSQDDEVMPIGRTKAVVAELRQNGADIEFARLEGITHFETSRFVPALRAALPWLEQLWQSSSDAG